MGGTSAQNRTLARLALEVSSKINRLGPENCHVLIACSKSKGSHRDFARNLYVSPLYRKSALAAEGWSVPFSILSAKYGLLNPDQIVEPYELTLKGKSLSFKAEWASRVSSQLKKEFGRDKWFIVLAGDDYLQPLLESEVAALSNFFAPMKGLSLGNRLAFLNQCIRLKRRKTDVAHAYDAFAQMSGRCGMHELKNLLDMTLPVQGVYFFFDKSESTTFSKFIPRLVRIGTHGVSVGSTATLRTRLRTHYGTRDGRGNHRASVFRLHVGRAIIERDGLSGVFPDWGKGQSATKSIIDQETPLEKQVSEYIGKLYVLIIPVSDTSGVGSLRAIIERQFIALFTEYMCPLETPSKSWLGRYSDKSAIRETGLWNIRDVGGEFDFKFVRFLEGLLSRSIQNEMDL
jgi:hypothetical protein